MSEDDVVGLVLDRLESLGIEYMLVGSYASNSYGRPRGSYDADIVVRIQPQAVDRWAGELGIRDLLDGVRKSAGAAGAEPRR